MNALQLSREKASGEKKGRFLGLQTILGLISLGAGYYLAVTVENPLSAVLIFFSSLVGNFGNLSSLQCRNHSFPTNLEEKQALLLPT